MKKHIVALFLVLSSSLITFCDAQYTILHNFNDTNGVPSGDVILVGKLLFGMTNVGGAVLPHHVSVFVIDTDGNGYRVLHEFDSTPGYAFHFGSLIYSNGVLYGTTSEGGANSKGTIFLIDTNGNGYKDLFDFDSVNGAYPSGSLTLSGKTLYGMTADGGTNGCGCIFRIDTNGTNYRDIYNFLGGMYGLKPYGALTLAGKMLYGMTFSGGISLDGEVFSIDTNGTNYNILHEFIGTDGGNPYGSLTLSGSTLYGMTSEASSRSGYGNIFSIDTDGSKFNDMLEFNISDGDYPGGSFILSGGTLYGMTAIGGETHYGVVFKIDTNANGIKDLFYFDNVNGGGPSGSLTLHGKTLYGMTADGGINGYGVIFKIDTNAVAGINSLTPTSSYLKVYPNPSNGMFTIQSSVVSNKSSVEVYNELGQQVYSNTIVHSSSFIVNLSKQPAGMYFIRVVDANNNLVGTDKIVVQ